MDVPDTLYLAYTERHVPLSTTKAAEHPTVRPFGDHATLDASGTPSDAPMVRTSARKPAALDDSVTEPAELPVHRDFT